MMARAFCVLAATVWLAANAAAQDASAFAGKPLGEALGALQAAGVKLVFSSELVRPEMRVATPPKASRGEPLLRELLQPHGLDVRKGPGDTWLVVAGKPSPLKAAPKPAQAAPAPRAGTIAGRVVDGETGEPIADVQVRLEGTTRSLVTDKDGRFEIADVDEGTHDLSVSMVGYALARRQVIVGPAQARRAGRSARSRHRRVYRSRDRHWRKERRRSGERNLEDAGKPADPGSRDRARRRSAASGAGSPRRRVERRLPR